MEGHHDSLQSVVVYEACTRCVTLEIKEMNDSKDYLPTLRRSTLILVYSPIHKIAYHRPALSDYLPQHHPVLNKESCGNTIRKLDLCTANQNKRAK